MENNLTVTLAVDAGSFSSPASSGGVTASLVSSTQITLSGSASNINSYLDTASHIKYTGAENVNGSGAATITVTANDGAGSGDVGLGTISINITAVNDNPTASIPASVTVTEDTESNLDLSGASFADVDDASQLTVTLTVDQGTFSSPYDGFNGVTATRVSGTVITLAGTEASINTYPGYSIQYKVHRCRKR